MTAAPANNEKPRIADVEDELRSLGVALDILVYLVARRFDHDDERRFEMLADMAYECRARRAKLCEAYNEATGIDILASEADLQI